jgi:hypothetical protein
MLRAMRALLICVVLGCGGSQSSTPATTPPPPAQTTAAGSGSAAPAGSGTPLPDSVIDKLAGFKDQLCACPDNACMEKVNDDMNAWGKTQQSLKDAQVSDAQTQRLKSIMEEMQKCVKRVSNMGG